MQFGCDFVEVYKLLTIRKAKSNAEATGLLMALRSDCDVRLCYLCDTLRKGVSGMLSWYGYCAVLHLTFRAVAFSS